ncbi:transcription elongation factor GreA [bacterium]|nr:MAG: transcription elongation factor GreA [bacterium]
MAKKYLTKERYDELAAELLNLKKEGRRSVMERLKQAKDLGDLSENAEYQSAREDQSVLERRIAELEDILKNSALFERRSAAGVSSNGMVHLGSKVSLDKNGVILSYTLVGSNEADPMNGLISNDSPLGRELLTKKAGDKIQVHTPKGQIGYSILSVD